jgi:molybdopterin-guanine dinucleotide biosynthesis protein A
MVKRAALVLSGGKARRFQTLHQSWQDKALALLEGTALLVHVVKNVADRVDQVVVCVDNEERKARYHEILESHQLEVKIVVDEPSKIDGGPNAAILTGLKAAQADFCMVIPCDMPFVKPNVSNYLFNLSEDFEIVVPMWPNGMLESLIMVFQRSIGLEIVQTLCQLKRSRPSDIPRATSKTLLVSPLKTIKNLDPNLESFININTKEDLEKLQTRNLQGPIQQDVLLNREKILVSDLQLLREADKMCQEGNFRGAQEQFDLCRSRFEECGNFFWAALASESKGEALLKQAQLLKIKETVNISQTVLKLEVKCKEAFAAAVNNYHNEATLYEKNQCVRLLERTIADKQQASTFIASSRFTNSQ